MTPAYEKSDPAPNDPGIPESAEWELWHKPSEELIDTYPTEEDAIAARNALLSVSGEDTADDYIVGKAEWDWHDVEAWQDTGGEA